jgi:hypothetical protein
MGLAPRKKMVSDYDSDYEVESDYNKDDILGRQESETLYDYNRQEDPFERFSGPAMETQGDNLIPSGEFYYTHNDYPQNHFGQDDLFDRFSGPAMETQGDNLIPSGEFYYDHNYNTAT